MDASVSIEQKTVRLDYEYNNNIIYLLVTGSENDISESKMPQLAKSEEIIIDIKNNKVPVTLIADDTGTNGTIIYRGQWKYANCLYELSGIIAVSYTHLDVYKRQVGRRSSGYCLLSGEDADG